MSCFVLFSYCLLESCSASSWMKTDMERCEAEKECVCLVGDGTQEKWTKGNCGLYVFMKAESIFNEKQKKYRFFKRKQ